MTVRKVFENMLQKAGDILLKYGNAEMIDSTSMILKPAKSFIELV